MNNKISPFASFFESAVCRTIDKHGMIEKGDTVVVALSGGADSVCLLLALCALSEKMDFSLCACHLNHMIRKNTAERDEAFSKALCGKLSVPFYSEKIDVPSLCKEKGGSVETVARNARYAFFERAKAHFCARRIATAHTASDNAETVIFNLVRGAGGDGICGIPPVRGEYIRPLIGMCRHEVEEYLDAKGQDHITDETNEDQEYSRNFLRHSVIPQLKKLNPELEGAVLRLSESAREDKEFLSALSKECVFDGMTAKELCAIPLPLLKRHIRESFSKECESRFLLSLKNTNDITSAIDACAADRKKRTVCLPGNICAVVSKEGLCFSSSRGENESTRKTDRFFDIPQVYGENIINEKYAVFMARGKDAQIAQVIKNEDIVYKLYKKVLVASDIIDNSVFVRPRKEHDVFVLGGMSRKLKKVFADAKIPSDERPLVPLVCKKCENGSDTVVCLPLFSAPCDDARPDGTKDCTIIAFYRS